MAKKGNDPDAGLGELHIVAATPRDVAGEDSNMRRAAVAHEVLSVYARSGVYRADVTEPAATIVTDFLCDLQHFCRIHGIDFKDCLRMAEDHHEAEKDGL
jgi:hypothetical protein